MLYTNLNHIESAQQFQQIVEQNKKIVVACGRMDPTSVKLYNELEVLRKRYHHILFYDFECDHPEFRIVLPELAQNSDPAIVLIENGAIKNVVFEQQDYDHLSTHLSDFFQH